MPLNWPNYRIAGIASCYTNEGRVSLDNTGVAIAHTPKLLTQDNSLNVYAHYTRQIGWGYTRALVVLLGK